MIGKHLKISVKKAKSSINAQTTISAYDDGSMSFSNTVRFFGTRKCSSFFYKKKPKIVWIWKTFDQKCNFF